MNLKFIINGDQQQDQGREFLASIVDSSSDAILSKTMDGVITSWNKGAELLYGYTRAEVIGKHVSLLVPPDCPDEIPKILNRIRRGEKIEHYETTRRKKDGSLIHISLTVSPVHNSDGQLIGASAIARDITEQKRLEIERQFLASLVNSSEDAIFSKSLTGIILSWNKGAERLYGYTPDEVIGRNVSILAAEGQSDEILAILDRLQSGEILDHYETLRKRKDGSLINVSLVISPIRDNSGKVIAASAIARDITDRIQPQNLIQTQLEEKNVLLQEVYHRVKNNLQLVLSLLELSARHLDGSQGGSAFQDSIARIRAMALVHEKMMGSQNLTRIDFGVYLKNMFEPLVRAYSDKDKVQLFLTGDSLHLGTKMAVPLGLIFNELITNALKYAYSDGTGTIEVDFKVDQNFLIIRMSDNGIGMRPDTDPLTSGTFGFKIIKLLVQQLDGKLEFAREKGSTFTLSLTVPPPAPQSLNFAMDDILR